MNNTDADVVVIGAGPYGLSIASFLLQARRSVVVAGEPMATWRRNMPIGMCLKSTPRASSIADPNSTHSFARFRAICGESEVDDSYPIPIAEFIAYGQWFANDLVPIAYETVKLVERDAKGFVCTMSSGATVRAKAVVVASGVVEFAYLPQELVLDADDAEQRVLHSSCFCDPAQFAGKEIAVLGAGQSALESAVLAKEAGAIVHLICSSNKLLFGEPPEVDRPSILKPSSMLGPGWSHRSLERHAGMVRHLAKSQREYLMRTILGPSGAWWLHPRFQGIDVRSSTSITSLRPKADALVVQLSDGEELTVAHLVAGTGYRPDVSKLGFLSPELMRRLTLRGTSLRLSSKFETPVEGLFLTGLGAAPTFGPLLRFVAGTGFSSKRLASGVESVLSRG